MPDQFEKIMKNNEGTTLLELLVAVGIFTVIMMSAMAVFRSVIEGQRNAIASQDVQESMRYAFEVMSKEARMAQKNTGTCTIGSPSTNNSIYNTNNGQKNILFFINKNGDCTIYELSSGRLQVTRGAQVGFLTPAKISISNLSFIVPTESGTIQPMVTFFMDAQMVGSATSQHLEKMTLQSTVSSRYYQ